MRAINPILLGCFLLLAACGGQSPEAETASPRRLQLGAAVPESERLVLASNRSAYTLIKSDAGYSVATATGEIAAANSAPLRRIRYADISLALDIDVAGKVYRLYRAAFNREPDTAGLGYWLAQLDNGHSLLQIAAAFIGSEEFVSLYGAASSDLQFITALYSNVLHRVPDQSGQAFWLQSLRSGVSRAQVLVDFSESAENQLQVAPSITAGVPYAEIGTAYRPVAKLLALSELAVGSSTILDASVSSDANGDKLYYSWSAVGPTGSVVSLTPSVPGKVTLIASQPGSYTVTLVVNDGALLSTPHVQLITATAKAVTPILDTGTYKCSSLTSSLAASLFALGHTYLDRDNDGKPCEASDKAVETPVSPPVISPVPSSGQCWVNGYRRSNGTWVNGYWRRC